MNININKNKFVSAGLIQYLPMVQVGLPLGRLRADHHKRIIFRKPFKTDWESPTSKINNFCHTMLYISAAYVIMQCLSVTFVDSVIKNFSPSGSHTILVFPHQTSCMATF